MVFKCCVPNCKGNYNSGPKVNVFSFPNDENLKAKWLRAICRENFTPTSNSKVCELHFKENEIEREFTYFDGTTNVTIPAKKVRLLKNVVPSVLPNCPKYLSAQCPASRESAEERRLRKEEEQFNKSMAASVESVKDYEASHSFSSFESFVTCIRKEKFREFSTFIEDDIVIIGKLVFQPAPSFSFSVTVDKSLCLRVFKENCEIKCMGGETFPKRISNLREIEKVLSSFVKFYTVSEKTLDNYLSIINNLLTELIEHVDEDKRKKIIFVSEQLNLLNKKSPHYSTDLIGFCSKLQSISPHAYEFLRSDNSISLPHPKTLHRLNSPCRTSPQIASNVYLNNYVKNKNVFLLPESKRRKSKTLETSIKS